MVGETPNLAARLQAVAEPGTVVIASSTRPLTGGLYEYRGSRDRRSATRMKAVGFRDGRHRDDTLDSPLSACLAASGLPGSRILSFRFDGTFSLPPAWLTPSARAFAALAEVFGAWLFIGSAPFLFVPCSIGLSFFGCLASFGVFAGHVERPSVAKVNTVALIAGEAEHSAKRLAVEERPRTIT